MIRTPYYTVTCPQTDQDYVVPDDDDPTRRCPHCNELVNTCLGQLLINHDPLVCECDSCLDRRLEWRMDGNY